MNVDDEMNELFGSNDVVNIALSYSRLSDFDRNGPISLIKRTKLDTQALKIGSIVDTLVFEPDRFDDLYHLYDGSKPTATLGTLCDVILKNYTSVPSKETVLQITKDNKFWNRSKDDETRTKNFDKPEFWEYLDNMFKCKVKTLITTPEHMKCTSIADIVKTHKHSKELFSDKYELVPQVKFEITVKGVKLRGIIDMVLIDHEKKTIRFVDLKTGKDSALEFKNSFLKYRYYLQEAVYCLAYEAVKKELGLESYSDLSFQFLYIGKTEKIPVVINVPYKWHNAALTGFTTTSGYTYRGLYELLDEVKWHFKNNEFSLPRGIAESNGILDIPEYVIS